MNRIKYSSFLSFLFFLFCQLLLGQKPVEVSYAKDERGNYQFFCNNKAYCNYVLEINFTTLQNLKSDQPLPYLVQVKPGNNKLFKLSKEDISAPEKFNYRIGYNKGCINPSVNAGFTYLLPIGPGKEAQAYEQQNTGISHAGGQDQKDWYVIRLRMNPGDTLYAARRGTVTEVDDNNSQNDEGAPSAGTENYIEVVHKDCSFGHYGILRKNSAMVKPGQFVEAGDPIGLIGGDKYGRGSEARFSVYYNEPRDSSAAVTAGDMNVYWTYIPLQFWTKRNGKGKLKHGANYVCERPETVVTQEMTSAEIKKRKSLHGKPGK